MIGSSVFADTVFERVHFIAVCGTAMASVAAELTRSGVNVSGSDVNFYPPMGDFLREQGVETLKGFHASHLSQNGLVVVGNAVSRGNLELEEALNRNLPLISLPELIRRRYLTNRRSVVVAGTHGKTTVTSMVAHILSCAGRDPGWLVGGLAVDLPVPCESGVGDLFVIEGDEYDSAWFDKRPKFLHYYPYYALLTGIEFDHSDIYADFEALKAIFRRFIGLLPQAGCLVVNADDPVAMDSACAAACKVVSYGRSNEAAWRLWDNVVVEGGVITASFQDPDGREHEMKMSIPGEHNLLNGIAAIALCAKLGVGADVSCKALSEFHGVARRLQLVSQNGDAFIYDDFAHHPTAVKAALNALKLYHPGQRLWAVLEPRSNTMVKRYFQDELTEALGLADISVIGPLYREERIPREERLDRGRIVEELRRRGKSAKAFDNFDGIVRYVNENLLPGDVVVVMSNGGFGGILKLIAAWYE